MIKRPVVENPTHILELEGETYVKATYLKESYNITPHRLSLWRQGRGAAKDNPLRSIQIQKQLYLYNLDDILVLLRATKGDQPL